MKFIKILFACYLAALVCSLGALLLIAPHPDLWNSSPISTAIFQNVLRAAGSLSVLCGATTMFLFGLVCVGTRKTLIFLVTSMLISVSMEWLGTSIGIPFGISTSATYPGIKVAGFVSYSILLCWFFMGFTAFLLASKLVAVLKLVRQTLWSLLLGTYLLISWDLVLNSALAGQHLSTQAAGVGMWQVYGSYFGMPIRNPLGWLLNGLLFLSLIRLLWRSNFDTRRMITWLPFGVYTASTGFAMALNIGVGLWFPPILSAFFVLLPESLVLFPRQERYNLHASSGRKAISVSLWWVMRASSLVFAWRRIDIHAEGLEHIPSSGPTLVAARHFHWLYDGLILVRTIRQPLHTIIALDWVQARSLRLVIEFACSLVDWPVVLRSEQFREHAEDERWAYDSGEARQYLRQVMLGASRLLRSGSMLVIFPEGYPNIDPHPTPKADLDAFLPFRPGFVKLVELAEKDRRTRVAIIPAGLSYRQEADKHWHATVRYGPALYLSDFASADQLLHAVEERVQSLSSTLALPPTSE